MDFLPESAAQGLGQQQESVAWGKQELAVLGTVKLDSQPQQGEKEREEGQLQPAHRWQNSATTERDTDSFLIGALMGVVSSLTLNRLLSLPQSGSLNDGYR